MINIAMSSDKNYEIMYVAIYSILMNAADTSSFHFHILTEGDFEKDIKRSLVELVEPNKVDFYNVEHRFKGVSTHLKGIPTPTYYRLLLPDILSGEQRVLYLDTDVVVLQDLKELYKYDLQENLVAGVKAYAYPSPDEAKKEQYKEKSGVKSLDTYINAGVLLMNLEEMRRQNFVERSMKLVPKDLPCQDQDIINILSEGKRITLPFKYNVCNIYYEWKKYEYQDGLTDAELREALGKPVIIHYANWFMKPWIYPDVPFSEVWWTICKSSRIFSYFWKRMQDVAFYNLFYNRTGYKCKTWNKNIWELLRNSETVIVYGAGKVSKEIVQELKYREVHIDHIMITNKENGTFEGVSVISVDEMKFDPLTTMFVVATGAAYTVEIVNILQQHGYYKIVTLIDEKL